MTPAEAREIQQAYDSLKRLVDSGEANERQRQAFTVLGQQLEEAQAVSGATGAYYRGMKRGVTAGLSDDIAGMTSAIRGDGFQAGREASLQGDRAAQQAFPSEFGQGEIGGAGVLAGGTMFMGGPVLAGAGMGLKMLAGGGAGAGLGALQGQSDYEMAGSPEGERLSYYAKPMVTGGAIGAAAYPVGKAVGAAARFLRNSRRLPQTGYGSVPSMTLTRAIQNTQDSGQDIQQFLRQLSPEATLADVPGDLQGTAQALAAIRGTGGTRVAREITERAEGAGGRISREMDANIAPANAAFERQRELAVERTGRLGPQYDAALGAEGAVQVRPLLNQLSESIRVAGPDTAPVLQRFANDLLRKAENGMIDPVQLHWIRSDLSDAMQSMVGPTRRNAKRNALLNDALDQIDEVLDTIPGYADARTGYANNRAMERSIEAGQGALRGGRASALSPQEFEAEFSRLSDAQKDAFRQGLRRDIAALMGTSRNDAASAWGEFAKNWNEEKLRIALGDAVADPIIKRLRSEQVFSMTRGRVVAGSKTGETQEAASALGPYRDPQTGRQPGPVARVRNAAGDKVNRLIDGVLYGNRQGARNAQLGEMLTLQGPERDMLIQNLLTAARNSQEPSVAANALEILTRLSIAGGGGAASAAVQ
jgi:hypothetical protein